MKTSAGFLSLIYEELHNLQAESLEKISRLGGLCAQDLINLLIRPKDHTVDYPEHVDSSAILSAEEITTDIIELGQKSLDSGETAAVVYFSENNRIPFDQRLAMDMTLLGMKQIQTLGLQEVWYIVPASIYDNVKSYLGAFTDSNRIKLFKQFESIQLTPDNRLIVTNGTPQYHSCGTGDSIACLSENGTLQTFLDKGGKYLYFVDMANLLGSLDPAILGRHIKSDYAITYEITSRLRNEEGVLPCNFLGVNQAIENFRLSRESEDDFDMICTGSFVVNANLNFSSFEWPWHRMKRNIGNKLVIQYERYLSDLTSFYKTQFISVDRKTRYQPIRNDNDVETLEELFEFR